MHRTANERARMCLLSSGECNGKWPPISSILYDKDMKGLSIARLMCSSFVLIGSYKSGDNSFTI